MVTFVRQVSDRLLDLVVPTGTGRACANPKLMSRTCVSCPQAAGYLFRTKEVWSCCGALAATCVYYTSCNRTC